MDIVIQIQIKQPGGQINVTNKLKLTYSIGNKKKKKACSCNFIYHQRAMWVTIFIHSLMENRSCVCTCMVIGEDTYADTAQPPIRRLCLPDSLSLSFVCLVMDLILMVLWLRHYLLICFKRLRMYVLMYMFTYSVGQTVEQCCTTMWVWVLSDFS